MLHVLEHRGVDLGVGDGSPPLRAFPLPEKAGDPFRVYRVAVLARRGAWLRIGYSQRFAAQPTRPLLRLLCRDGRVVEHIMPAATFGRASWIGKIPLDLVEIEILACEGEAADFRFDEIGFSHVGARLLLRRRGLIRSARYCFGELFSKPDPAGTRLRAALGCRPLAEFPAFVRQHSRPVEPAGLDGPISALGTVELLAVVLDAAATVRLAGTLASLDRQTGAAWRMSLAVAPVARHGVDELLRSRDVDHIVVTEISADSRREATLDALVAASRGTLVGILEPGDRLMPEAMSALGAVLARPDRPAAVYTDSAALDRRGRVTAPRFKPDWSPALLAQTDYVGGLCLFDGVLARAAWPSLHGTADGRLALLRQLATCLDPDRFHHVRRVLLLQAQQPAAPAASIRRPVAPDLLPRASIVIPTRDRLELLSRAIASVVDKTRYPDYEIIVVDNESREPATLDYLRGLAAAGRIRLVADGGSFNFPRLVNKAVAQASGDLVVLLNNDTYVLEPSWLEALAVEAIQPGVGAVGAKLLYPDGTIQHAGIVVGAGGYAGHFHRRLPADHRDHLGRLGFVHELSAVTAACLAVTRAHWDEVGGFDESFAVDFNDVDFCLRLRERGLRNLWTPHAVLGHEESASRRGPRGKQSPAFLAEAARFAERWRPVLLNDPYFHPALSLLRFREMLE